MENLDITSHYKAQVLKPSAARHIIYYHNPTSQILGSLFTCLLFPGAIELPQDVINYLFMSYQVKHIPFKENNYKNSI